MIGGNVFAVHVIRESRRAAEQKRRMDAEASRSHLMLSPEQVAARDHVRGITAQGHLHSVTACPPFTRAMCSHRRVIETMRPEDFE